MNTPATEDKRLERIYDYTKFHIGIYLSFASGVAALLGSKEAGWFITTLIGNVYLLYASFGLLVIAGMCGGMVATSITESVSFSDFWDKDYAPPTIPFWTGKGKTWVAREHAFFWASLLMLAASILIRWPGPPTIKDAGMAPAAATCCCQCPKATP